jgi:dihydroflavonol-4-reductase
LKKKIIITGGSGFLAQSLLRHLNHNEFQITLLTRDKDKLSYLKDEYAIEIENIDWTDNLDIKKKIKDTNYVIHTAAMVPTRSDANNYQIIKSSLRICKKICNLKLNLEKFIYISTLRTCINTNANIFNDDTKYNFYNYDTSYGKSKYLSEKYLLKYKSKNNLPLIICAPGHIVGPENENISKSNEFIFNIFRKKINLYIKTRYAIVDILDVCESLNLILDKGTVAEKYLICNHNPTLHELIDKCAAIQGKKVKIYLPLIFINISSIFFEFLNKIFKLKNMPLNRSSYHFAKLSGKFEGKKIEDLGLKYTELDITIKKLFTFYKNN